MRSVTLTLQPLTAEAFAPYGDVMEVDERNHHFPINAGLTERYHQLATVDVSDKGGYPIISIFRSQPVTLPFQVRQMERHPLGSQSFTMLSGKPYVVIVGRAGKLQPGQLQAFLAAPHQSVNYHKGTWHHYCLCLQEQCDFLVVDRGGKGSNCDEVTIDSEFSITVEADPIQEGLTL